MKSLRIPAACLFFVFLPLGRLSGAELQIEKIDFDQVEQAGAREPWYQIAVTIDVTRGDRAGVNPRFADDLTVRIAIATESEGSGGSRFSFYQAEARYPTLEEGSHVVRCYLPPEIVKRDRVRGEPYAYFVEVSSGGEALSRVLSPLLSSESRLAAFNERLAGLADRALRWQEETPFAWANPRGTPVPLPRRD